MPTGVYIRESLKDRFERQWVLDPETGCWIWIGILNYKGYGFMRKESKGVVKKIFAHRFSHEFFNGVDVDNLVVHHTCHISECVNPQHLITLSVGEHTKEHLKNGDYPLKTHCPHGHQYIEGNIYYTKEGHRNCRTCNLNRSLDYQRRKREGLL